MLTETNKFMKLCMVVLFTFALSLVFLPSVGFAESNVVDLERDNDGDDVPDELMVVFDQFTEKIESQEQVLRSSRGQSETIESVLEQNVEELYRQLGYSDATIKQIEYLGELQLQLNDVDNLDEAERIHKKIQRVERKLMSDERYAQAVDGLNQLYQSRYADNTSDTERKSRSGTNPNRGEIMLSKMTSFGAIIGYSLEYGHAGAYDGESYMYESIGEGVVLRNVSLGNWDDAIILEHNQISNSQAQASLDWAKETYNTDGSTDYNINFWNKNTDSKLYCSQLIWKIGQHYGYDLDSNPAWFIAYMTAIRGAIGGTAAYYGVTPEELMWSDYTTTVGYSAIPDGFWHI